jgi:hypothetical protein
VIGQLQYIFRRKPSRRLIEQARAAFAEGRSLPGVEVRPIAWTGTVEGLKRAIKRKTAYVGNAGIVKQYAEPDLSMCDYDSPRRAPIAVIVRIAKMLNTRFLWLREDRTRHGWHMLIKWARKFEPAELVAIQCLLGSDLQRETYNLSRVLSGKKSHRWNLLFERKL